MLLHQILLRHRVLDQKLDCVHEVKCLVLHVVVLLRILHVVSTLGLRLLLHARW